ncbi:MAG TPA: hypothetical protein DCS93_17575 [Microscillaceae bacterium]|nr:hypothetical protein [Microscillaceae bacterium]
MNQSDKKYLKDLLSRDPRLAVEKLKDHLTSMPKMLAKATEIETQQESLMGEAISQGERENRQSELNDSILHLIEEVAIDEVEPGAQIIGHPKYRWILFELIALGLVSVGGILALVVNQLYIPAVVILGVLLGFAFIFGKSVMTYLKNQQTIRDRGKKYYADLEAYPNRTKVLIEGDSWFNDHNGKDAADYLSESYNVYSFAEKGIKMRGILKDSDFRKLIVLEKPQVVLLSAGGRELFEGYFKEIVKTTASGDDFFTPYYTAFKRDIAELYEDAMEDLATKAENVIVSGYDHVVYKKGAVHDLLTKRGFSDINAVKTKLIDDLNEIIDASAAKYTNVFYVDLRGTLTNPSDWQDELHPNAAGFSKIADKFKAKIEEVTTS